MKALAMLIIGVLALFYPLVIFLGVSYFSPAFFGIGLLIIAAFKLFFKKNQSDVRQLCVISVLIFYSLYIAITNDQLALRFYPVIVSLSVAGFFWMTLFDEQSIIERIARIAGKDITDNAKRYTRALTAFWVGVLLLNAVVAGYMALYSSLRAWAIYNSFVSYLIFFFVFALEFLYRQYYIKKYGK